MSAPEFSRLIKPRALPPEPLRLVANEEEATALAHRFGVTAVEGFTAEVALTPSGRAVLAEGRIAARITQPCAVSGEALSYAVDEPVVLRFVPARRAPATPDEEIELAADELDEIEYDGEIFDLGEELAQSLGLAIDPYRTGPAAEKTRAAGLVTSEEASGPFAALASLRPKGEA